MNINLIIKLTKLANNNPNENEANAAARKVCRLIAEANYQFAIPKVTIVSNPPSYNDAWARRSQANKEEDKARAEEEKKRYRSVEYPDPASKGFDFGTNNYDFSGKDLDDLFNFMNSRVKNPNFYVDPSYRPPNPEAQQKPKVSTKCSKCGKFVETILEVSDPSQFRCSQCVWEELQSKRGVSYDTETKG